MAALEPHLEPEGTVEEKAPGRNGHRYLSNRLDCLDYPRALALGLPIGSGMIESGHRHVLHARLKKAGTAWLKEHARFAFGHGCDCPSYLLASVSDETPDASREKVQLLALV